MKLLSQQKVRFLMVGMVAALVHFLSLFFFVEYLELLPIYANIFAFFVAFWFSFIGHFSITFSLKNQTAVWLVSLCRWLLSSIAGFLLNQGLFALFLNYFGQHYYLISWIIVTGLVTLLTFGLAKFWAFR